MTSLEQSLFIANNYSLLIGLALGLAVGSFLNVIAYRLPIIIERELEMFCKAGYPNIKLEKKQDPKLTKFNLVFPSSFCPACGCQIRWRDNVPLASFLVLRGRCRHCNTRINASYPIVEIVSGAIFALFFYRYGINLTSLAWCFFCSVLVTLTLIDWRTTLLPDYLVQPLIWGGLIASGFNLINTPLLTSLVGVIAGFMSLWIVNEIFTLIRNKEGIGRGDFKLLGAIGGWLGWQALPTIVIAASVLAGIIYLLLRNRTERFVGGYIPFGPFLAISGIALAILRRA